MIVVSDKYRMRSEQTANRIVRKNIAKIINALPLNNITPTTFEVVVRSNITEDKIKAMYKELYFTVGKPIYQTIEKKLKRVKFFNENLFNELMAIWLQQNAGLNIISVQSTLIQTILNTITQGYEQNLSVADISRLLQQQGFYRAQSLRIARTETTTITNASTVMAGNSSDLVLDKVWISAQDKRTRREPFNHLAMNGVKVGQDEDFNVSGEMLAYPGDITNREVRTSAANIIQCRCKVALVARVDADGLPIRK
jgi:hypothetical protein